ncbi:protein translocase SEC61 complex subunit gamma [Candidatus Pacearchaeota archaeon]|nr:protein translocase SEC61 complex subunit gamma [Candidatus Pacearchaeota archaeon]
MFDIKSFTSQCVRVWHLLKKPDKNEFTTVAKVSALGLGLIGIIGFAISILMGVFKIF